MLTILLIALGMLALSFFFSGVEIAFFSVNRLKIELKEKQGNRAARILSNLKKKWKRVLITILIGNNIALVVFTKQIETLFLPWMESLGLSLETHYLSVTLILTLIGTLIILIFAEYIPKAIFKSMADRVIFPAAYPLNFFVNLLQIPVQLINAISRFFLQYVFRVQPSVNVIGLGREDLDFYVKEMSNSVSGEETKLSDFDTEILTNALDFRETKAREFMIPRIQIEAVPVDCTVEEVIEKFIETNHSKIIVYGESLDDIKGYIHTTSLFEKPEVIDSIIQEVLIVPETMPAKMLFLEFSENKKTVAIVVDEFGGTEGLITMEDLVEEIFGEIEDEYDEQDTEEDMKIEINEDGSYLLGARVETSHINEQYDFGLPEDEAYNSLGGLFTFYAGDIPKKGDEIVIGKYKLTVLQASQNRIIQIRLEKNDGE
jgi:CBS domain containing-hemolysin-like protein